MKKLATVLCLCGLSLGTYAQGLVIFANNPTTLVSANPGYLQGNYTIAPITGPVGSYYFALLTSPSPNEPANMFTFTGLYATNVVSLTGGRFSGGTVAVPGWAPGTTMYFEVAGWQASLGHDFNPAWLTAFPPNGLVSVSPIGSGVAGGGPLSIPPLPLFGGSGITQGFGMIAIPEPNSLVLAGLGLASLLIGGRRK